ANGIAHLDQNLILEVPLLEKEPSLLELRALDRPARRRAFQGPGEDDSRREIVEIARAQFAVGLRKGGVGAVQKRAAQEVDLREEAVLRPGDRDVLRGELLGDLAHLGPAPERLHESLFRLGLLVDLRLESPRSLRRLDRGVLLEQRRIDQALKI